MTRHLYTTLFAASLLILTGPAQASMIGDSVDVRWASFPSTTTVTVVSPGIELPGASIVTFGGSGDTTPRWDINIENNFITIDFLVTQTLGPGSAFTFSDLDWVGPPGPGIVTGVIATTNQSVIPISTSFTSDSVRVNIGSNTDNWQVGDEIRLDLQTAHIPEPATAGLMSVGAFLPFVRRRR